MVWVSIGIAAAVIAVVIVTLKSIGIIKKSGPGSQDYQDVIVSDAVDVYTQQYVSGVGAYFPNINGIQSTPTVMSESNQTRWNIELCDLKTGRKYNKNFSGQIALGRDPAVRVGESKLVLTDGMVSKNHCLIRAVSGRLTLTDLSSKNGTYLNGNRITGTVPVKSGDRLGIGDTLFEIHISK